MELHIDEKKLLKIFQDNNTDKMTVDELSKYMEPAKIMRTALWLSGKELINILEDKSKIAVLTEDGKNILKDGLPERRVANYLKERGINSISIKELGNILNKNEIKSLVSEVFFRITFSGEVYNISIITTSGNKIFDSSVLEAIKRTGKLPLPKDRGLRKMVLREGLQWKFSPSL